MSSENWIEPREELAEIFHAMAAAEDVLRIALAVQDEAPAEMVTNSIYAVAELLRFLQDEADSMMDISVITLRPEDVRINEELSEVIEAWRTRQEANT